jgi:hypothetical protein
MYDLKLSINGSEDENQPGFKKLLEVQSIFFEQDEGKKSPQCNSSHKK